jgi:hypothetical protein
MLSEYDNKNFFSIDPSVLQQLKYSEYREKIEAAMSDYEEYIETMESFLKAKALQHSTNIQTAIENGSTIDLDEHGNPSDITEYDQYLLGKVNQLQNLLRQAFFVSLFSFFEAKLVDECLERKPDNEPLLLSDISGHSELDKVNTYFKKVLGLSFPNNTIEWMEIKNLQLVRNLVVHNKGKVSGKYQTKEELLHYIERSTYLEMIEQEILIKAGFCEHALKIFKSFLLMLTFGYNNQAALPE